MLRRFFPFTINQVSGGTGYLDAYPGASMAISTRLIYSSYLGPCMDVTPDGVLDTTINFSGNQVDEAALLSLASGGDLFVSKMYDQSGNGVDWTATSLRPRIVSSGVVEKFNGVPSLNIYIPGLLMSYTPLSYPSNLNSFYAIKTSKTAGQIWKSVASNKYGLLSQSGSTSTTWKLNYGTPTIYLNKSAQSISTRGDVFNTVSPEGIICEETVDISSWSPSIIRIGVQIGGSLTFIGYLNDWIEFEGAITSGQINGISDAINTPYSIY